MKIKVKDTGSKTIKILDKSIVGVEKLKDNIVLTKEKINNTYEKEDSINNCGGNTISNANKKVVDEAVYTTNKYGKKSVIETKNNIDKLNIKMKEYKAKKLADKTNKKVSRGFKLNIKTSNNAIKNTNKVAVNGMKKSQKAFQIAKATVKNTIITTKRVAKSTINAIKAIIAGTKVLVSALVTGGFVAFIIIVIICMIGLLLSSAFGIFFSSEKRNNTDTTMNKVVSEINIEFASRISNIQKENTYDDYIITSNRAEWRDVLALYSVKQSTGDNQTDVIVLNADKTNVIKQIFWDMNIITSTVRTELVDEEQIDDNGVSTIVKVSKNILYIDISSKTVDEMSIIYNFNDIQKEQLKELLKEEYVMLWSSVIYGTSIGSSNIVEVAASQLGNIGGQPYWSWYGYSYRVEWCAIFVSWVANQTGYIEANIIPKFAGCGTGVNWFKAVGQWKEKGFIPSVGDIIFFDWEVDGQVDHVGIVEKVENGKVYTIEGNSNNEAKRRIYVVNSEVIFGYGTPMY